MIALHRRLLRLEALDGRLVFRELSDNELHDRLRAELRTWLREDPGSCPPAVRAEVQAFLGVDDEEPGPP